MTPAVTTCNYHVDSEALSVILHRRGLTGSNLAHKCGTNKSGIYRLLSGERTGVTYPTARAIADALRVDVKLIADPELRKTL